jgi:hypothetical protein
MTGLTSITVFAVVLAGLSGLAGVMSRFRLLVELQGVVRAANENIVTGSLKWRRLLYASKRARSRNTWPVPCWSEE